MPNKLIMSIFLHTVNIINKHGIADIKKPNKVLLMKVLSMQAMNTWC